MQGLPSKTLIIRLSSVGDIVLSSLLIRVLRKRFPQSQIDFLVKSEYASLVRGNPHVSHVLELPDGARFADLRALRQRLHDNGYELVVDIHDSLRSRYLSVGLPGDVVRVRKRKVARFLLVTTKVHLYHFFGGSPGVAERYLEPVREWGVENDGMGLEVFVGDQEREKARHIVHTAGMDGQQSVLGIAPSARHWNKRWPADRFAAAAAELSRRHRAGVILFGAADERDVCGKILQEIRANAPRTPVLNLAGSLTLTESAAVMDHCTVVLSNDSGLMHVAAGRKRKVVALFGPTVKELGFFPFGTTSTVIETNGLRCRPCTHIGRPSCPKAHFRCMLDIPVSRVVDAVNNMLAD